MSIYKNLGTTISESGCYFAIHAPAAHHLHLVIFDTKGKPSYFELEDHGSQIYSAHIPDIAPGTVYSYCLVSKHGKQWLVDPYAKRLITHPAGSRLPAAVLVDDQFDWQNSKRPEFPSENTLLYEVHVKGFSKLHPGVPAELQGKYLGLCHPVMIEHFKSLGVTSLQLMPITSSVDEPHLDDKKLTNYWGYNPLCWFAPDNRFAIDDPVSELKMMVRELHHHGIEVILDVVYNHTAEGGEGGNICHFKALDPLFYLHNNKGKFENFTGCGNTVDLTHPPALRTVMDSLRYWVETFQVDGFRFDLASSLGRRGSVFDKYSGFFQAVYQDPVLQKVKLIAEPWDIGPDGYQLGHFPVGWVECNDKYRDSIRSFWHGQHQLLGEFATRQMGSRDLFSAAIWPGKYSVNYISYHDGFTLQDLVSYRKKHNDANCEENRDGHGDNRSYNHGIEGETTDVSVIARREQQKRNMIATLLFSFGMPHLLATDSLSHTQGGNNNAYCQDNEISWTNWSMTPVKSEFLSWLQHAIELRKQWMLPMIKAFSGNKRHTNRVHWRQPNGEPMHWHDWESERVVSLHLGIGKHGDELLLLVNPTEYEVEFQLPEGNSWEKLLDTSDAKVTTAENSEGLQYSGLPHSFVVMRR